MKHKVKYRVWKKKYGKNHGHKNMTQHVTIVASKTMQKMQQHTKFNQMNL